MTDTAANRRCAASAGTPSACSAFSASPSWAKQRCSSSGGSAAQSGWAESAESESATPAAAIPSVGSGGGTAGWRCRRAECGAVAWRCCCTTQRRSSGASKGFQGSGGLGLTGGARQLPHRFSRFLQAPSVASNAWEPTREELGADTTHQLPEPARLARCARRMCVAQFARRSSRGL